MPDEQLSQLLKEVKKYHPHADLDPIRQGYAFAQEAHKGQMRKSGAPYIDHVVATALLLAQWHMPPQLVLAGLLHDVPEDTKYNIADIEKRFGKDLANIVEGETKLSTLRYHGRERYAENLRKMFFAIAQDVRVVLVKFADRVDNLKTLNVFPIKKQQRIALETIEIYAAIANRLGMGLVRGELEDLAFKSIHPQEYKWVLNFLKDKVQEREKYLEQVKKTLQKDLIKNEVHVQSIHGRIKRLYSLYLKLLTRDRDINKIYDLVALRIIVPTVQECYASLGALHQRWTPLKGRVKDYIAQPKPNGYQSLHTTIFCDDGEIVEFQIRTPEMHEEAEFGIAAHWFYDEQGKMSKRADEHVKWLKELASIQKNIQSRENFLEALDSLKIDIFQNRIFVFTPKGDVIDLPEKATPVDYAYAIHTEIGSRCAQAMVNGTIASLSTPLRSGDVVEIITDKNRKGPSPDWLEFVKTSHARNKIKDDMHKTKLSGWIRELVQRKHKSVAR